MGGKREKGEESKRERDYVNTEKRETEEKKKVKWRKGKKTSGRTK